MVLWRYSESKSREDRTHPFLRIGGRLRAEAVGRSRRRPGGALVAPPRATVPTAGRATSRGRSRSTGSRESSSLRSNAAGSRRAAAASGWCSALGAGVAAVAGRGATTAADSDGRRAGALVAFRGDDLVVGGTQSHAQVAPGIKLEEVSVASVKHMRDSSICLRGSAQ